MYFVKNGFTNSCQTITKSKSVTYDSYPKSPNPYSIHNFSYSNCKAYLQVYIQIISNNKYDAMVFMVKCKNLHESWIWYWQNKIAKFKTCLYQFHEMQLNANEQKLFLKAVHEEVS